MCRAHSVCSICLFRRKTWNNVWVFISLINRPPRKKMWVEIVISAIPSLLTGRFLQGLARMKSVGRSSIKLVCMSGCMPSLTLARPSTLSLARACIVPIPSVSSQTIYTYIAWYELIGSYSHIQVVPCGVSMNDCESAWWFLSVERPPPPLCMIFPPSVQTIVH